MKQLIKTAIVLLAGVFFFSACSSLSITKRRYTKGYFVEHHSKKNHKPHGSRDAGEREAVAGDEAEKVVVNEKFYPSALASANVDKNEPLSPATAKKPAVKRSPATAAAAIVPPFVKQHVKALKHTASEFMADTSDDALSLLWIVVVVILVLYLIGLLMELGPYTHILGVIALVLLILWLLRII